MTYVPLVIGETVDFRAAVESIVDTGDHTAILERISELTDSAKSLGLTATHGAEIEYAYIRQPDARHSCDRDDDKDLLYEEVVEELEGKPGIQAGPFSKGDVIWPEDEAQVMVNFHSHGTYNPDQLESDISEIRTYPAEPLKAIERYWRTIDAIGIVAARHDLMGAILSTHWNSVVYERVHYGDGTSTQLFLPLAQKLGGLYIAAVQYNLNALRSLQIDSNLEHGLVVNEAFPITKDASTTVHNYRLEYRHPMVGVADPRIDVLAVQDALLQLGQNTIPKTALDNLRHTRHLSIGGYEPHLFGLDAITYVDDGSKRVVIPAQIEPSARHSYESECLDSFVRVATLGEYESFEAKDGAIMQSLIRALQVKNERFVINPKSPFASGLKVALADTCPVPAGDACYRVLPKAWFESPELYPQRRDAIKQSSTARNVLGRAINAVVPGAEAAKRRQELIDARMIIDD